jgi:hypothetical protein
MEDRLMFCRKAFCKNRLGTSESCPKDGEASVSAGEKLRIDTEAIEKLIQDRMDFLETDQRGWVCPRCDVFSDKEGKCDAGHVFIHVKTICHDLEEWRTEATLELEKLIGLPSPMPVPKKPSIPPAVASYISELIRNALKVEGITDAVTINAWQMKATELEPDDFLKEARLITPELDLTALENYVQATKTVMLSSGVSVRYGVGDEVINAFLPKLSEYKGKGDNYVTISNSIPDRHTGG